MANYVLNSIYSTLFLIKKSVVWNGNISLLINIVLLNLFLLEKDSMN